MTPLESRKNSDNSQSNSLHTTVREIIGCYWPALPNEIKIFQLNGGFSGAVVFQVSIDKKTFCLKGHLGGKVPTNLALAHETLLLAPRNGLLFLPIPKVATNGNSLINFDGRVWELLSWVPGEHIIEEIKSLDHLRSVVEKIRELHEFFAKVLPAKRIRMPGWIARINAIAFLGNYFISGKAIPNQFNLSDSRYSIHELIAWGLGEIKGILRQQVPIVATQLCWGDARPDNVHFFDNKFSGFTDFSSLRVDSLEVDIARFLGEFCVHQSDWYQIGLEQYGIAAIRNVTRITQLDVMGILASLSNWLKWILSNRVGLEIPTVTARLRYLKMRLIKWKERGTF